MIRSAGSKLVVDSWVVLLGVNSVVLPAVVVGMLQIKKNKITNIITVYLA